MHANLQALVEKPAHLLLEQSLEFKKANCRRGKQYIICSNPKSGSSFLLMVLRHLTLSPQLRFVRYYGRSDQELYYPAMLDHYSVDGVVHQHFKASNSNIELLTKFDLRPVILTRNEFDVVVSLRDHLINDSCETFSAYYNHSFGRLSQKEQYDQIIELGVPWDINFFVGWYHAAQSRVLDLLWITYEDLIKDKVGVLSKVCAFYQIEKSAQEIRAAVDQVEHNKKEIRFNKGVAGRGATLLSNEQKARILDYARFYPDVDFSAMGLTHVCGGKPSTPEEVAALLVQRQGLEFQVQQMQTALHLRAEELTQARLECNRLDALLCQSRAEIEMLALHLQEGRQNRLGLEKELQEACATVRSNAGEYAQVRKVLDDELHQCKAIIQQQRGHNADMQQQLKALSAALAHAQSAVDAGEAEIQKERGLRRALEAELEQVRADIPPVKDKATALRETLKRTISKVNTFRRRLPLAWHQRGQVDQRLWDSLPGTLQQLKDDSLLFGVGRNGYQLQASCDLASVANIEYPLAPSPAQFDALLLAPLVDGPVTRGELVAALVSVSGQVVAERVVPAAHVKAGTPLKFDFASVRLRHPGSYRLRVLARDVDAPIRILEWRKAAILGLARARTRAFCGFVQQQAA